MTRLLAIGGSRRKTLAVLLSVALHGQSPDSLAKGKGKGKGRDQGVQGEGWPGAAHHTHHQKRQKHRQRRRKRRQQDRGPDSSSPAPCEVSCAGACCEPDQICNRSVIPNVCCTPPSPATTCAGAKCGEVIDTCGQVIDCGGCPSLICQTATCSANDHHCHYTTDPDGDPCVTGAASAGVCDGGQCVAGCDSNADCVGRTNTCTNHICTCGGASACAGQHERCCGDSPGGVCVDIFTDPSHCGECGVDCPPADNACQVRACINGEICSTAQAANNTNPGGFCAADETCCDGNCTNVASVESCGTCGHHCDSQTCSIAACIDGDCKYDDSPIGAPGPGCADSQCCFGVCCANPNPHCLESGQCAPCQSDAQCLSGQFCCNGNCSSGSCRPVGCVCEHDDQCCRGTCGNGIQDICCLLPFEECTFDSECCTGDCDDGRCS